jgi:hypothetical protein
MSFAMLGRKTVVVKHLDENHGKEHYQIIKHVE